MGVKVKLFAGLRERAGWSERDFDDITHVEDVWPALSLGPEPAGLLYAVNKEYVERGHELSEGDEVAVIPPVSGGSFRLSADALSLDAVVDEVRSDRAGAIATFVGTTRVESRGRTVEHLDYEAYEGMAEQVMAEIADELKQRYDLCEIAIHHRTGRVEIGTRAARSGSAAAPDAMRRHPSRCASMRCRAIRERRRQRRDTRATRQQ
jgi:molybdopterin converting factor small subunit